MSLHAHVPDVIRHTALRSSDFPPPENPRQNETLRQRPPSPPASPQSTALPVLPIAVEDFGVFDLYAPNAFLI